MVWLVLKGTEGLGRMLSKILSTEDTDSMFYGWTFADLLKTVPGFRGDQPEGDDDG